MAYGVQKGIRIRIRIYEKVLFAVLNMVARLMHLFASIFSELVTSALYGCEAIPMQYTPI